MNAGNCKQVSEKVQGSDGKINDQSKKCTTKEESTLQIHPIKKLWSIITTSNKYPTTTLGMSQILNMKESINSVTILYRQLLEILIANNRFKTLTIMQKMKKILNLHLILW